MGHTLTYRTCQPVDSDCETAIRQIADAFNQGRDWVLAFSRDHQDGRLNCSMEPSDNPVSDQPSQEAANRWPGPYEAKCLLEALCGISRNCKVDLEVWATYSLRPVGVIRDGECRADLEAHAEAVRSWGAKLDQRAGG